jgi:hypothetical protein
MEALIQLAVEYGIGIPFIIGGVVLYFLFNRIFKIMDKIEDRLDKTFTQEETKEYVELKLEPTHHIVSSLKETMDKIVTAFEKLDDTMDEIKQELARRSGQ